MPTAPELRTLDGALTHAGALVDAAGLGAGVSADVRSTAAEAARSLYALYGAAERPLGLVALAFTAELLASVAVDVAARRDRTERLIGRLESELRLPRVALGREVLRTGHLLELSTEVGIEVALSLALVFAGGRSVSLWRIPPEESDTPQLVATAGGPSTPARTVAQRLLAGGGSAAGSGSMAALRLEPLGARPVALIGLGHETSNTLLAPLLAGAAPILSALLERQAPVTEASVTGPLISSVERRLHRLRFDLHDGPQQDIHLLAQDLRLFRDQLRPMIAGNPDQGRALGRLDDLEAQMVALDGDLRRLVTSVESPFLSSGSIAEPLRELTDAFAQRTGVAPRVELRGSTDGMTDSQQIALLSLIREALANIREHADARNVTIAIAAGVDGASVEITDDGRGFEPQPTLVRSARAGRLGLVGMHERVRMLGGSTRIDSRPGGPTVISAKLPPWQA
ncbi:MAG: hypothetical protein JOZ07_17970 [Solirubrobacterales bacterium]|nr:hypothetical protein [Solirubrobacterales bacterium]